MKTVEEAGHPVMNAEHTYDIMIKNAKNNDAYHMLDTPHNELHGITMMVTNCKCLSLFSSIIEIDKISPAQVAPDTSCFAPPAIAVREDLPIADFATREGVRAYAPWEEQPAIPEQIPTGPLLLQFLSLKAGQNKVPEIGDYYQVRPRSQQVKLPVCYEYNLDDSSPNNGFAPFHELQPNHIFGPVL